MRKSLPRLNRRLISRLLLGALASPMLLAAMPPARAAELENYERKYISFYPANYAELNLGLISAMQKDLPRFGYQALPELGSLEDFARAVYAHQQAHAGDLAADREPPDLRYGDKVVSWEETRRIMESAFVLVPEWEFGPLALKNLHRANQSSRWMVDLGAPVTLNLGIYRIQDGQALHYASVKESWDVSQEHPVDNLQGILSEIQKNAGNLVDAANPLVQPLILAALKTQSPFSEMLAEDPARMLRASANQALQEASYANLLKSLRQLGAFSLKTQVESVDKGADQLLVSLPPGESAASLGAWLDQGYKIVEYRREGEHERAVEVGFARVRSRSDQELRLQPILAARDFELGDQLVEYPQTGIQVQLVGGSSAFGFSGLADQPFVPQGGLRLEASLARLSNVSELYAVASGSAGLPLGLRSLPAASLGNVDPGAAALPVLAEVGIVKRWFLRQWMLEAGIQGGLLAGALFNSGLQNTPASFSLGATALVGTGWQVTPDLLIGLQGGWRYYLPGEWKATDTTGPIRLDLPGLSSNGPVLQAYGSYMF